MDRYADPICTSLRKMDRFRARITLMRSGKRSGSIQPGVLLCLLLTTFSWQSLSLSPPSGWRLPDHREIDQQWRAASPTRYIVARGDFTGDGSQDTALILVRNDGTVFAPFFALTGKGRSIHVFRCEKPLDMGYLEEKGLKLSRPGTYRTACGKGYYDCEPGEKESITIWPYPFRYPVRELVPADV
jgi:hypothetical protein